MPNRVVHLIPADRASRGSRNEQKLRTRQRLIDVALGLSAEHGFSALSLREVTKAAGITPAAFYRHFRDMEELGLSLVDQVGLSLRRLLRDARHRTESEKGMVKASIDAFMDYLHENGNLFRLLLGERQGASPAFRKAIHAELDRFVSELSEDLERYARSRGAPLRNPEYAAEATVAVVFTVGAEALELPRHKQASLAFRLAEEVKMILRGARAASRKK
ncbi:MAG: HTH-type transcriptional repressor FabR [Deltaproteobacteria bacterium]|nr:HTH-type transcriptional repressor FabR [Deltaproteobacteria bacterium]